MPKASLLPSILRTVVPLLVGLLLTWPITAGLGITEEQATAVTTTVVTAAYYLLVRLAEQYVPQLGWLLGYASAPLYKPATDVSR